VQPLQSERRPTTRRRRSHSVFYVWCLCTRHMASDNPTEGRAAKRRTTDGAPHAWQCLVRQPRAVKTAVCTALVVAPTDIVGTVDQASTELGQLAHAALSLQAAFANRPVLLPGVNKSKTGQSNKQLEGRYDRDRKARRMQAKRVHASSSAQEDEPPVLATLAHGQALAQALGSPIDGLSIRQQERACEAIFADRTSSMSLVISSWPSEGDELPCHRCGDVIKLEQDDSMVCVHCNGEPIHRGCLPHGERKHECQWCSRTRQQPSAAADVSSSPMSLGTLLAILYAVQAL
jgi:hypothetical protein